MSLSKWKQKLLVVALLVLAATSLFSFKVAAQTISIDPGSNCEDAADPDNCEPINFDPIELPVFVSLQFIENFSPFSYVALALNLVFVLTTVLWVFLMIKAAVDYMRSQGDEGMVTGANKQIGSVFASITILFVSFLILIVIGTFLNLGNFFDWPRVLSTCTDGTLYVTKALELEAQNTSDEELSEDDISDSCFNGTTSRQQSSSNSSSRSVSECQIQCASDPFFERCVMQCSAN